jgi:hypothetical protein
LKTPAANTLALNIRTAFNHLAYRACGLDFREISHFEDITLKLCLLARRNGEHYNQCCSHQERSTNHSPRNDVRQILSFIRCLSLDVIILQYFNQALCLIAVKMKDQQEALCLIQLPSYVY